MDLDQFEHTAAWLEFCDGMTRFEAEAEAAKRQGKTRWEAMNAIRKRDTKQARDTGSAAVGKPANNLPRVQPHAAQEKRSLPVGVVSTGWGAMVLLALLQFGGRMV